MKSVDIEGKTYRLAALPLKVLAANWRFLVGAIVALFQLGRLVAQMAKEGATDKARLLGMIAEEQFPELVAKALAGLSTEQLETLLGLIWQSVERGTPGLNRDVWDDLLTVPVTADVLKAFFAAQGLEFKKDCDPGEAKPEATPAT